MRILVLDNYDSFTYNLVQYLGEMATPAHEIEVVRNDHTSVDDLLLRGYDRVIVSPGPCTPNEAGVSMEAMKRFPEAGIKTLGVCLGHQSLGQVFGATVTTHMPVHGKTTTITHDGAGIFTGLPQDIVVGRYHSLVVSEDGLPACFEVTSRGGDVVMGIRHRELPVEGVQFHPESVLTPHGKELIANWVRRLTRGSAAHESALAG